MDEITTNSEIEKTETNLLQKLTKKERIARRKVYDRFKDMRDNTPRTDAEQEWEDADKMFRQYAPALDEDDWRANLVLPDGFAAIQASMQEAIARKSRPLLEGVEESDEPREDLGNDLMTFNMDKTGFDFEYFRAKYAAAIRGTAFLWEFYRLEKRKVKDPTSVKDGELVYKEKEIVDKDDTYTEWIENEFVYVDPAARDDESMIDCIRREVITIDEFRRIYGDKAGFKNVDNVTSASATTNKSYFEMPKDLNAQDVEILHYYNRSTDEYIVCANNYPVHIGPIPYKHKELPLTTVYHYRVPGRFWGLGIPKVIYSLTEERKSIRNLNLDRQKMQLNKMFLYNRSFDLDEEEMVSRPHGLIGVDTQGQSIDQVIRPLEYGDVPASYFKTEDILLEDIRRAHGIDDRIQGVNMGGTATEAAILKESALKRINMITELSELSSLVRVGRLKWSNIQFFYPIPRIEKITVAEEEREKKVYRTIPIEGKQYSIVKDEAGGSALRVDEVIGKHAVKLNPAMARYLEGEFDIVVKADAFANISKPIHQAKTVEMLSLLMSNPVTLQAIDGQKTVRRILDIFNEEPEDWMASGLSEDEWINLADKENKAMVQGELLAPTRNATQAHNLVHLQFTKGEEYQSLPQEAKDILNRHIMGEIESITGSMGGGGGQAPQGGGPTGAPEDNLVNASGPPNIQPQSSPRNQVQSADMQPTNLGPKE